jgi:hypothetical protein
MLLPVRSARCWITEVQTIYRADGRSRVAARLDEDAAPAAYEEEHRPKPKSYYKAQREKERDNS